MPSGCWARVSTIIKVLDRFSAVGLLAVPGIDLISACKEIVRAGEELLTRLGDRLRGMDRITRTDRLRAAHAVIVLTAYFEALDQAFAGFPPGVRVRIAAAEQLSWPGGQPMPGCGASLTR